MAGIGGFGGGLFMNKTGFLMPNVVNFDVLNEEGICIRSGEHQSFQLKEG